MGGAFAFLIVSCGSNGSDTDSQGTTDDPNAASADSGTDATVDDDVDAATGEPGKTDAGDDAG